MSQLQSKDFRNAQAREKDTRFGAAIEESETCSFDQKYRYFCYYAQRQQPISSGVALQQVQLK